MKLLNIKNEKHNDSSPLFKIINGGAESFSYVMYNSSLLGILFEVHLELNPSHSSNTFFF